MTATPNNKPLAHMFWDGPITTYQKASILSAYNAGFHVILWSFTNHPLPPQIEQRNAEEILLRQEVSHLHYLGWHKKQTEQHRERALYSDFFRAEVLDQMGGWWFDTDLLFFKSAEEFEKLKTRNVIAGEEPHTYFSVNNAVLSFGNKKYATLYKRYLYELGKSVGEYKWGVFGPGALNKMFSKLDMKDDVMSQKSFYPVSVGDRKYLYAMDRMSKNKCYSAIKDSYCLHWWNSSEFNKKSGFAEKPHNSSFLGLEFQKVFDTFNNHKK
jgi:hypothetical protein